MLENLEKKFKNGQLIHPNHSSKNIVTLSRALALLSEVAGFEGDKRALKLASEIGHYQNIVLVLIDGFGLNLISSLPPNGFLKNTFHTQINSVFPSATAPALTSLCTGFSPEFHKILGWTYYLPEKNLRIRPLPFNDLETGKPLLEMGISPLEIFNLTSLMPLFQRSCFSFHPVGIDNSPYSRFFCGGTPDFSYDSLNQGFSQVIQTIKNKRGRTFIYFYNSELDTLLHHCGIYDETIPVFLEKLDKELSYLKESLDSNTRIIVTADHGQINIKAQDQLAFKMDEPFIRLLRFPPTGEKRSPFFHVKEGYQQEFKQAFEEKLGNQMILLSVSQIEQLQLFGPHPLSSSVRQRLGDWVGMALEPVTFEVYPSSSYPQGAYMAKNFGQHGGLDPGEMQIPIFIS